MLGASAGFTLYSNLYIGPMTSACLAMLAKVEDLMSRATTAPGWSSGLRHGQLVARAGRAPRVRLHVHADARESPGRSRCRKAVSDYFVDQEDDINKGVGTKGEDLPTEGHWFWRSTNDDRIRSWAFRNRDNLWGMFYGAAPYPTAARRSVPYQCTPRIRCAIAICSIDAFSVGVLLALRGGGVGEDLVGHVQDLVDGLRRERVGDLAERAQAGVDRLRLGADRLADQVGGLVRA